ncbi:MAG: hypothetical protein ACRDQ4_20835 [Pseudonocardiaceae bacterium]
MSDVTNVKLAVQDPTETTTVAKVIEIARGLGVAHLPHVDRMVTGRVWPGGHRWVGEVGEGKNLRALDDMYESMVDAIKAVDAEIRRLRDAAVNVLMNGGVDAAQLATTREQWQFPVIKVFADSGQQEAWLLQLPA